MARWKIHPATVERLRKRYALGRVSMAALARQYGVGVGTMSRILRGERRRKVAGPLATCQLRHASKGEAHGRSKLTARQVRQMRRRYARGGVTQTALARAYGVTSVAIHFIVQRKTWTHLA